MIVPADLRELRDLAFEHSSYNSADRYAGHIVIGRQRARWLNTNDGYLDMDRVSVQLPNKRTLGKALTRLAVVELDTNALQQQFLMKLDGKRPSIKVEDPTLPAGPRLEYDIVRQTVTGVPQPTKIPTRDPSEAELQMVYDELVRGASGIYALSQYDYE